MLKERIFVSIVILILLFSLVFTIYHYENKILKQQFRVSDGVKIQFTSQEIIEMIKKLPDYQGDSLVVFDDGTIKSLHPELNGALQWNLNDTSARLYLEGIAKAEHLPLAFVVYRHILPYYIEQQKAKKNQ